MWSDVGRRIVRGFVYPAVERVWTSGAWLAGRLLRPAAAPAIGTARGRRRVLVVAPHPDDETIGAGGVAALHLAAGDAVTVLVVTDGGGSRAGGLSSAEMARRRRAELEEAMVILGIRQLVCLGLPEGRWRAADAADALRRHLGDAELVYAPSCIDYHPEHLAVARLVGDLVRPEQLVRVYELGVPLTPILANCLADIREVAGLKARAVAAFRTQRLALSPFKRRARYHARLYGVPAAELFWELRGERYARVMAAGDWRGGRCAFRGVRGRPFTDPLSDLVGFRRRLVLRRAAGAWEPAAEPAAVGALHG